MLNNQNIQFIFNLIIYLSNASGGEDPEEEADRTDIQEVIRQLQAAIASGAEIVSAAETESLPPSKREIEEEETKQSSRRERSYRTVIST